MRTVYCLVRSAAFALGLAACNSSTLFEPSDPSIRTDRAEYAVTRRGDLLEAAIGITYTNRTGGPIYLMTSCPSHVVPPVIEKRGRRGWAPFYRPTVTACAGAPILVGAGEVYRYTYNVTAGVPGSRTEPQFETASIPGTYRLVWDLYEPRPGSTVVRQVGPMDRLSNSFRLREER